RSASIGSKETDPAHVGRKACDEQILRRVVCEKLEMPFSRRRGCKGHQTQPTERARRHVAARPNECTAVRGPIRRPPSHLPVEPSGDSEMPLSCPAPVVRRSGPETHDRVTGSTPIRHILATFSAVPSKYRKRPDGAQTKRRSVRPSVLIRLETSSATSEGNIE